MRYGLGVDVGGTFTDTVIVDEESGRMHIVKVPTRPRRPDQSVAEALEKGNIDLTAIGKFVHGTTVSTNTVIERSGAKVGLLTTEGFEDILEIQRIDRAHLYDLQWDKPSPLVPRNLRLGIKERINHEGEVVHPLEKRSVEQAVKRLKSQGVAAIAICLLFSYVNPEHERIVRKITRETWPDVYVSISSDVMNEFREYERSSTVVVDAYVKPRMADYLKTLESTLSDKRVTADISIMKSSGGIMTTEDCREQPVNTLMSGPAGGVIGAKYFGQLAGFENLLTFDMGGTSADVALIDKGEPQFTTEQEIEWGIPVKVPMIDVRTIGAGGGSVAWIDKGGRIKVGPHSVGADPGPACYGHGNLEPTVTDANVVLGYLNPDNFLGGAMSLDATLAERSIKERIAEPLDLSVLEAAQGIVDIANATMNNLIRQITVQAGYDPREFALVAFGGSGPTHAAALAQDLGIKQIVVPPSPGVLSAFGMLLADPRYDFVQSYLKPISMVSTDEVASILESLEHRGRALLARTGYRDEPTIERFLDMRYMRQNYSILTPVPQAFYDGDGLSALVGAFAEEYERLYGYRMEDEPVEIVNCQVSTIGRVGSVIDASVPKADAKRNEHRGEGERLVYFKKWKESRYCPILERGYLPLEKELPAPCVIEQMDTTIVLNPDQRGWVDENGNIIIGIANAVNA